ncbi:MAG: radical SAM protein [Vicinamibacterales bacterium]
MDTASQTSTQATYRQGPRTPLTIGLVQINNSFSGQCYLPYAVGLLQAYLIAHLADWRPLRFLLPVYVRRPVQPIVTQLLDADVVFFSVYVWNLRLSLAVARELKRVRPATWIVFGGPQIADDPTHFLQQHPEVDVAVSGEGEQTALGLAAGYGSDAWQTTPGIAFRSSGRGVIVTPKPDRLTTLDAIPSPYLTGVFDPLMTAHPEQKWIALWETNRGCPFSCTFCDWGAATASKVHQFGIERLYAELDWFAERAIDFVFCCDANFGMLPRDVELARYVAHKKASTGFPKALSVQGTKNATERAYAVQKTLADAGLNKGVTLSMQSLDHDTLEAVKRSNIKLTSYEILQQRFSRDRIETYADLILGLPNETYETFVNGVSDLIGHGQHNRIQFNNLTVLPNAPMAHPDSLRRYGMVLVDSPIVNIHGSLAEADEDIVETQPLVVATSTMAGEDWVRTRAFSWFTALLHFDKVFQIPLVLAHELTGTPYRTLLESFTEAPLQAWPILARIRSFFAEYAAAIQQGGPEYVRSKEFLNIYWPADEFMLIQLVANHEVSAFYDQARAALLNGLGQAGAPLAPVLTEAVRLNDALLKRPFTNDVIELSLTFNVWECYRNALIGERVEVREAPSTVRIDRSRQTWWSWDDYCRDVIWFGNKKGAYLYAPECDARPVTAFTPDAGRQIAGIY